MAKQVVLVTGASRGIGKAISVRLAEKNYDLILNDVLDLETTSEECRKLGAEVKAVRGDISSDQAIEQILKELNSMGKNLAGLVNNAFTEVRKPFLELTDEDWNLTIRNSFMSAVKVCRALLPHMIENKKGSIVNIASVHSFGAGIEFSPYDASKAAMIALTKSLSIEFGKYGIRANAVAPGLIITERNRDRWFNGGKDLEYVNMAYPLGRPGNTSEVAGIVEFLISDDASFITGGSFPVDGGMLAYLPEAVALRILKKERGESD